jgi:serine/threonine protein kinase
LSNFQLSAFSYQLSALRTFAYRFGADAIESLEPDMPLTAGTQLGPYEIVAPIGAGGMGEVYRARDTRLDRIVAIKISKEQFSERFEREARAVAALNHPNICTLFDVGPNYLVMEYIEGPTLAERIRDGAMPVGEALPIARQIAEALEAAHEKGIVHRDLKPANIKLFLARMGSLPSRCPSTKRAPRTASGS